MLKKSLFLLIVILSAVTVSAQEETEPAMSSALTGAKLPAGAVRVLPSSVPAEISQSLASLVQAGEGKLVQDKAEVIAWMDGSYKKANAASLMREVQDYLQVKGWLYEVGGTEDELTFFSALKENPTRRAVLGYFIVTDEALVLAWTEVLPAGAHSADQVNKPK